MKMFLLKNNLVTRALDAHEDGGFEEYH